MAYLFTEFDTPHQADERAREILSNALVPAQSASEGDFVAFGFPARKIGDCTAEFDTDNPLPEVLIQKASRFNVATASDMPPSISTSLLKWIRVCRDNPENIRAGLTLFETLSSQLPQAPSRRAIIWCFANFMGVDLWHPQEADYGISRSRVDGDQRPQKEFLDWVSRTHSERGVDLDLIYLNRTP